MQGSSTLDHGTARLPCMRTWIHDHQARALPPVKPQRSRRRCRCTAQSSSASVRSPQQQRQQEAGSKRLAELRELVQDVAGTAFQAGPQGPLRALQAASALSGVGRDYIRTLRQGSPDPPARLLRKLFEGLGATYIKLGQFIASSPTLFPEEYVVEFQACLDQTSPVPWDQIKRTIEGELQRPLDAVFSRVDPTPLASASIAQVHTATLRDSNKDVVIKVLKPGVEDVLTTDLNFLSITSKVLQFLNPELARTSLVGIVADIRASMLQEVDFQKEAEHIKQFDRYLDRSGMRSVATCPFVYEAFSSRRVLTMERLHGAALTDLQAVRSITTAEPEMTLIAALNTWFGSLAGCETFHADVHAGNLLVLKDGRIGFIDFGNVSSISPTTWAALQNLVASSSTSDFPMMARALAMMGAASDDVNVEAFAEDLRRLFAEFQALDVDSLVATDASGQTVLSADLALDDVRITSVLLKVTSLGETHGIRFPREFGLLLKQMLYFDRYTRILAPTLSVMQDDRVRIRQQQQQQDLANVEEHVVDV